MKALAILFFAAMMGVIGGGTISAVVTYLMPRKYESSGLIEIKQLGGTKISHAMAELKSDNVLQPVAEKLDLKTRWNLGSSETVEMLGRLISVKNIRGTDLLSVTVRHTDREEAREIANAIVQDFSARKNAEGAALSDQRLKRLIEAIGSRSGKSRREKRRCRPE
ncbi:MAG: hypothetical protein V4733_11085 [Verrucomicrobiota bacterium]